MATGTEIGAQPLITDLKNLLLGLNQNPYPFVPNPPNCKRRAAVAVIIRIRPTFPDVPSYITPSSEASFQENLDAFFEQPWVQRGEPELALIKRAARKGDRWTSHIALPGGKRDPEDESDRATSIREAAEEIGLDLTADHSLYAGNLPERVVTTESGKIPLMVLCPFVFLLTRFDIPPLQLQPTEVGSTHWIPIRALLSSSLRTYERADVVDRIYHKGGLVARGILRLFFGQFLYDAIRLMPSESIYSRIPSDFPAEHVRLSSRANIVNGVKELVFGDHAGSSNPERPLLLWGLTYGMICDLLDLLPSRDGYKSWKWPTLSSPDVRFFIWLVSRRFRYERMRTLPTAGVHGKSGPPYMTKEGLVTKVEDEVQPHRVNEARIDGMGITALNSRVTPHSAVGHMFDGYNVLLFRGVMVAIAVRTGLSMAALILFLRRYPAWRAWLKFPFRRN